MTANEFFKKVGIDAVRSYVAAYEDTLTDDLKRLVESHELVEFVAGDLESAKIFCEFAEDMKYLQKRGKLILVDDIRKAIADVESCMEVSSESN
ncbi:hypothetical protein [Acinetobacter indicus]|uniref:hypothetical protein n=1 Tax=Acinetobacter indicus TaxID=756892 RepID=UPI000948AFC7|nr:hypothetical protein [Acinetobacter indicus]